jgi:hypothetical protein
VAASLHHADFAELLAAGAFWAQIIPGAMSAAQRDINAILLGDRGLTPGQVLTWTGLADTHRQQTLFWSIKEGQGLQGLDPTLVALVENFDVRTWLAEETLLDDNGDPIVPDDDVVGPVGYGALDTTGSVFANKKW